VHIGALFTIKNRLNRFHLATRKITTPGVGVLQNVCGLRELTSTSSGGIFG